MERELLKQRYNFAEIHPHKNYSKLTDRPVDVEGDKIKVHEFDEFENIFSHLSNSKAGVSLHIPNKKDKIRKNTLFFYSDKKDGETAKLNYFFKYHETFITDKQRHIKQHYGNPFSSISVKTYERSVYVKNDRLTIKFNAYQKTRHVNSKYFKTSKFLYGVTIDLKTGNFTTYETTRTSSRVRRNHFSHLMMVLNTTKISKIRDFIDSENKNPKLKESKRIKDNLLNEFDDIVFFSTIHHYLNTIEGFQTMVPNYTSNKECVVWLFENITKLFVKINNIKVPNDYKMLLVSCYPTKKFLKKNDNKLIAAILDRCDIKSKQTIKLFHKYPNLDIKQLYSLKSYFGTELSMYLKLIEDDYFGALNKEKKEFDPYSPFFVFVNNNTPIYNLTKLEKMNLIKLLNQFVVENGYTGNFGTILSQQLNQVNDHFNMIRRVSEFYPDVKMRSKTWSEFHNEHLELSKLDRTIKRGYIIEYVFDERMVKMVEEPIKVYKKHPSGWDMSEFQIFYPVLLKQDIEYSEEGTHMHHCVASYANKEVSIIISLRLGSRTGSERVTNEFDTRDKKCLQSRYFCNAQPPENFVEAIQFLERRIKNYQYSIKSLEKKQTPLVINGKEVPPKIESPFNFEF